MYPVGNSHVLPPFLHYIKDAMYEHVALYTMSLLKGMMVFLAYLQWWVNGRVGIDEKYSKQKRRNMKKVDQCKLQKYVPCHIRWH